MAAGVPQDGKSPHIASAGARTARASPSARFALWNGRAEKRRRHLHRPADRQSDGEAQWGRPAGHAR